MLGCVVGRVLVLEKQVSIFGNELFLLLFQTFSQDAEKRRDAGKKLQLGTQRTEPNGLLGDENN